MDKDFKVLVALVLGVVAVGVFLTFQIQATNRAAIAAGLSYGPVATTTFVVSWHK